MPGDRAEAALCYSLSLSYTKEVINNPESLCAASKPKEKSFSVYDARCAAHAGDGVNFISSSNMSSIPELPRVDGVAPRRRRDGRLGPHSYTLWPQRVSPDKAHCVCIPRRPTDVRDPKYNDIAWHKITSEDWIQWGPPINGSVVGKFSPMAVTRLSAAYQMIKPDTDSSIKQLETEGKYEKAGFPSNLITLLKRNISRLEETRMDYRTAVDTFGEAQDLLLELRGYLMHRQYIAPLLRGSGVFRKQKDALHILGGFTSDPTTVEWMSWANIPCYYIRPYHTIDADRVYIWKVVTIIKISDAVNMDDWDDKVPHVDDGAYLNNDVEPNWKQTFQSKFPSKSSQGVQKNWMKPAHSANKSKEKSMTSSRALLKAKSNHNALTTTASPPLPEDVPNAVLSWAAALERLIVPKRVDPPPAMYALPPPHLFFQSSRRCQYLMNFLRVRHTLYDRLSGFTVRLPLLKAEAWRCGLLGEMPKAADRAAITSIFDSAEGLVLVMDRKADSREQRDQIKHAFQETFYGNVPWDASVTAHWRGEIITFDRLCENPKIRWEILWEIQEIGFRVDFIDLHLAEIGLPVDSPWTTLEPAILHCISIISPSGCLLPQMDDPSEFQTRDHGSWTLRRDVVRKFLDLLMLWPHAPKSLNVDVLGAHIDERAFVEAERAAQEFFCQTFERRFCRNPVLPASRKQF